MSFTNFGTGHSHSFSATYVELKPGERIRHTDRFDDPNLPGEMQVTVSLKTVACGTDIEIVQEGIPDMITTEFCYLGWQESLSLLANVVEPDIPAGACSYRRVTPAPSLPTPTTPVAQIKRPANSMPGTRKSAV